MPIICLCFQTQCLLTTDLNISLIISLFSCSRSIKEMHHFCLFCLHFCYCRSFLGCKNRLAYEISVIMCVVIPFLAKCAFTRCFEDQNMSDVCCLQSELKRLHQFVNSSRHASQTIFFGHYPTSTIGNAVAETRQLFGSVYLKYGSVYPICLTDCLILVAMAVQTEAEILPFCILIVVFFRSHLPTPAFTLLLLYANTWLV